MGEEGVGLVVEDIDFIARSVLVIRGRLYGRSTSDDEAIAVGEGLGGSKHTWQIVADFLLAAAAEDGDDGGSFRNFLKCAINRSVQLWGLSLVFRHFIHGGIADVVNGVVVLAFEEIDFEGKNGEYLVHVTSNGLDAPFLPRPQLGGDVIIDGTELAVVNVACYLQVEAGVVHEDDDIGMPGGKVVLALAHAAQDGAGVEDYVDDAHVGQVAVVAHEGHALCLHQVASEATELCRRVFGFQGGNEVGSMEVAAGLACDEVVLHKSVLMCWVAW